MCHASGGKAARRTLVHVAVDPKGHDWLREIRERTVLTSISRACSRSALALISRYAPSSVDAHASSGAFALINSHFSASSTGAKMIVSSPSASLPTDSTRQLLACARVIDLALYCY